MSRASKRSVDTTLVDDFVEFYRTYYADEIASLAQQYPDDKRSVYIDAADLYQYDPAIVDDWQSSPDHIKDHAEDALARYELPIDISLENAHVRLGDEHNTLPDRTVTDLQSDDIGRYVAVSGQLGRITGKSPRLHEAAYECQRCGSFTRLEQYRTDIQEPHECQACERQGPFRINHQQSVYHDQRKLKLEEPIEERSQARGQSVPVYVEKDLCDHGPGTTTLPDHAGERVTICGEVRVDESQLNGRGADPETEFWIDADAIVFDADDESNVDIEAHRDTFEKLASRDDAIDVVAESLAPSLHAGEDDDFYTARRAAAAWLFNAYRVDPDGTGSKRGDLHMALIGDPGTGKSTLMGYIDDILPNSEFRTGTGLTEVGLTAAAVQEEFAGSSEWTLQPGILPRADGGHCLIDEIDGVVDENTKAIHDALEGDQMVKTDKAGIKADLPTRTAVLVGGNPTYTRFDRYEPITEQIDLDPALFDRMDLVFALQDEVDEEQDADKAEHALNAWDDLTEAEAAARQGHASVETGDTVSPEVPPDVLRAWVAYARRNVFPTLTDPVKARLKEFYVEVRNLNDGHEGSDDSAVPATPRTLEAGIRLSIAFARLELSDTVEPRHAEQAIDLTQAVVGLRFDDDTGEFDDAMTASGDTKAQRDRIKNIHDLINRLEDETDTGAPRELVIEEAADLGISESKAEHEIEKLKQQGDLYEPATDHYRTT